jgi:hypothetical protein
LIPKTSAWGQQLAGIFSSHRSAQQNEEARQWTSRRQTEPEQFRAGLDGERVMITASFTSFDDNTGSEDKRPKLNPSRMNC